MSEMKKDTFMQRIKNKGLLYASAVAIVGGTGLVLLARGCPNGVPFQERPTLCEPVRGDGICCEVESYPYLRNPNGTVKVRNGVPVPNPNYSLEDCHDGDNVCQNQTKLADLRDAAGRPVTDLRPAFLNTRAITLPLENETSQDCIMQAVRDMPCAAWSEGQPLIDRQKITGTLVPHKMRQRTQEEVERMFAQPGSLAPGDNYFVLINNYEETCSTELPLQVCTPTTVTACSCPNLSSCHNSCGNGRVDAAEKCDSSASPDGCARGSRCNASCSQCVPIKQCGNGVVDGNERCDQSATPNGCSAGQTCVDNCHRCVGGETHSACRNQQCVTVPGPGRNQCSTDDECVTNPCGNGTVDPGEACDPPGSACGSNGRCSATCQCAEQVTGCESEVKGRFANRISSTLLGNADSARRAAGANGQTVRASVSISVSQGAASVGGISLSCPGCAGGSLPASTISLAGIPIDRSTDCRDTVVVNIPPG